MGSHDLQDGETKSFNQALDVHWSNAHRLLPGLPEEPGDLDSDDEEDYEDRPCFKAGMCICQASQEGLVNMRNRVFRVCKDVFHKEVAPANRKLLLGARLFAKVTWLAFTDEDEQILLDWGLSVQYWHIARVVLSPYELQWQSMTVATPEESVAANADEQTELCLKA